MTTGEVIYYIAINGFAWATIHIGLSWCGTRMSVNWFSGRSWWSRPRSFERSGWFYEKVLGIKKWKDGVPDAAPWFRGGFPKKRLLSAGKEYLLRYQSETRRGEAVHWVVLLSSGLFFIWNPPGIAAINVAYGLLANLPCIFIQRYNRIRIDRILDRRQSMEKAA